SASTAEAPRWAITHGAPGERLASNILSQPLVKLGRRRVRCAGPCLVQLPFTTQGHVNSLTRKLQNPHRRAEQLPTLAPVPIVEEPRSLPASVIALASADYGWRSQALCRDTDPDLFFPVGTTGGALLQLEQARAVCRQCPVQADCLDFALATNQDSGVW